MCMPLAREVRSGPASCGASPVVCTSRQPGPTAGLCGPWSIRDKESLSSCSEEFAEVLCVLDY